MELLPQTCSPWTDILIAFIVGLLESRQKCYAKPYNAILIVVDWYTKQACYFPCYNWLDAIGLAEMFAK
jgi:hypothetical protein